MEKKIEKLKELNKLVTEKRGKKDIIVLNPELEYDGTDEFIKKDTHAWTISKDINDFVDELLNNNALSMEMRIILLYEKMSLKYVYDDNLISYIKKVRDELYTVPDSYGRITSEEFDENRKMHSRRVCYELAREYAAALTKMFRNSPEYNVCILWDVEQTHYYVALSHPEYSLTLDMDDFTGIKDLTGLKSGLKTKGITILPTTDTNGLFLANLNIFNSDKIESGYEKIKQDIDFEARKVGSSLNAEAQDPEVSDNIKFIMEAMEIMTNQLHLDSQGIFEYMKEIIGCHMGSKAREKIWKRLYNPFEEERHIRCLLINENKKYYLVDGDNGVVRPFDLNEFDIDNPIYIRFDQLSRDREEYKGR